MKDIKRGDILYVDLSPTVGSEQDGLCPVLVIQNDIGNKYSPIILVAVIAKYQKKKMPTQVFIHKEDFNLEYDSVIMMEQIRNIDKSRIKRKVSNLDTETMQQVEEALGISLGLISVKEKESEYTR